MGNKIIISENFLEHPDTKLLVSIYGCEIVAGLLNLYSYAAKFGNNNNGIGALIEHDFNLLAEIVLSSIKYDDFQKNLVACNFLTKENDYNQLINDKNKIYLAEV